MEQSSHSFVYLYRYILFLLFCGCLCTGASCGSSSTQNTASNQVANNLENKVLRRCLNERTAKSILRWGEYDPATGVTRAYQWGGDLQLKKLSRETFKETFKEEMVMTTDEHSFCVSLTDIVKTFERVPTLNSPGAITRYIEYYPSVSKDAFRAVWNPRYRNVGNKDFRAIYDTLMTVVPVNSQW